MDGVVHLYGPLATIAHLTPCQRYVLSGSQEALVAWGLRIRIIARGTDTVVATAHTTLDVAPQREAIMHRIAGRRAGAVIVGILAAGVPTPPDVRAGCCDNLPSLVAFTSGVGVGNCGTVTNSSGATILNLACGGLYFGGGLNTVPLPGIMPDLSLSYSKLGSCTGCDSVLTLSPTTQADVPGPGCATPAGTPSYAARHCTSPGCLVGPPVPIPNAFSPPTSKCGVNLVASKPGAGTGTVNVPAGTTTINLPIASIMYLTGDLLPDAGVQPCPLCAGGTPGACGSGTCKGGTRDGLSCTPETSALTASYPTSLDCPPNPASIVGFFDAFVFPQGATTSTASDTATDADGPGSQLRTFCGFCFDADLSGTLGNGGFGKCAGGATSGLVCQQTSDCTGGTCVNATPCTSNADCTEAGPESRESCRQRNNGAFSKTTAQTITVVGVPAGDVCDGLPHPTTMVNLFCIPPTFVGVVDGAADLPGPGAIAMPGTIQLLIPTTTTTSTTVASTTSTSTSSSTSSSSTTASTSSTSSTSSTTPPCCTPTRFSFTTAVGVGNCGTLANASGATILNLACGGVYWGGGTAIVLQSVVPDMGQTLFAVTACNAGSGDLTLSHLTAAQTGSNRTCSAAGCLLGPPVAIPSAISPPVSTCGVNVTSANATGTSNCYTGATSLNLPITKQIYLSGDILPGEAGIQPCPICAPSLASDPCTGPSPCCHGGPSDDLGCTPGNSNLGSAGPTSQDCPPSPGLLVGMMSLAGFGTSGTSSDTATAMGGQTNVFCGFCVDNDASGTLGVFGFGKCVGGPLAGVVCAESANCAPGVCANPIPCTSSANCTEADPESRETCRQRSSGAFGKSSSRTITETGSPAGDLTDGLAHPTTLVNVFCVPPLFDGSLDGSTDLPGPGAMAIPGQAQLLP